MLIFHIVVHICLPLTTLWYPWIWFIGLESSRIIFFIFWISLKRFLSDCFPYLTCKLMWLSGQMGNKMDPVWLFNASPGPQNSQNCLLSHIVGNIWKTGCSLFFLVIHISALWRGLHSVILYTYKWILQNCLPGHLKHECYIVHVYLYLFWVHWYKTRIDGTINCILVYMVTVVTYKLRGTMVPCGGGGSHQHHKCDTIASEGETRDMSAW